MAMRTATLMGAGSDAEDVVQEAFVKAYGSLGRFRDQAPFRPWLLRIVANEAHNHHRTGQRRGAREQTSTLLSPELVGGGSTDPADHAVEEERRLALLAAVRELTAPVRQVVTCRYLLELGEAETATVLGVPRGTVKSRLSRGLTRLRQLISEDLIDLRIGEESDHG
jgi:RNA polymerase sigma-70 factor, ECF subfamily